MSLCSWSRSASCRGQRGEQGGERGRRTTRASEPETSLPPAALRGPSLARRNDARQGSLVHKLRCTRGSGTRRIVAARSLGVRGSAEASVEPGEA